MAYRDNKRNTFIGFIEVETAKAFLFIDHYWHEPLWLPKSQVVVRREFDTPEVVMLATPWITRANKIAEEAYGL